MTGEASVDDVDLARARIYRLLGQLLARAPDHDLLNQLRQLSGTESALGHALTALAAGCTGPGAEAIGREYFALFIGVTRGELVPFASYYLTGYLQERPLARVRAEMAELGISTAPGVCEPEDHIAALCEMMAGQIDGSFGPACDLARQQRFFDRHLAPWAGRFFEDLERAGSADFYRPVGRLGRLFMAIEQDGFAIAA